MTKNEYYQLSDISILNSNISSKEDLLEMLKSGRLSDASSWEGLKSSDNIDNISNNISSRLKNRMSPLSIGVCAALEKGPGFNLNENEEICLFTCFGEIEITNKIIKNIAVDNYEHVSPTLFHNSVHHTPLGYYTIIKKAGNRCITISDGLNTNESFINYIKYNCRLNESFLIVHGDEYSSFFDLDKTVNKKKLHPVFISYRISGNRKDRGFKYSGFFENLDQLSENGIFMNADNIFCSADVFFKLKDLSGNKAVYSEYPLSFDNPCGIIYRLAIPFYLDIKGKSLIIECINDKYHAIEVKN